MQSGLYHSEIVQEKAGSRPPRKAFWKPLASLVRTTGLWWADLVGGWLFLVYLAVQFLLPRLVSGELSLYFIQPALWISLAVLASLGWWFGLRHRPAFKELAGEQAGPGLR